MMQDISKYFNGPTPYGQFVGRGIIGREATPEAICFFVDHCDRLTNYEYWFFLSTLWVSYTGWSDLNLWKRLFSSNRSKRKDCIMKPSEVQAYERLPYFVTIYRAHRPNETDWIAYTLDENIAKRFAQERGVKHFSKYKVKKNDILALFLRRGEQEVIVLDKSKVQFIKQLDL